MKLIDKDKIVAELEKCYNECLKRAKVIDSDYWIAKADAYRNVLVILDDTIEVKEVDLAKEIDKFYGMYRKNGITFSIEDNQECLDWKVDCNPDFEIGFARHFFELGMTVSNKA